MIFISWFSRKYALQIKPITNTLSGNLSVMLDMGGDYHLPTLKEFTSSGSSSFKCPGVAIQVGDVGKARHARHLYSALNREELSRYCVTKSQLDGTK